MQARTSDTAVFVAGDGRIFFPALVFLTSLELHNPGRFDRFMCFPEDELTPERAEQLDRHGIRFINSRGVAGHESILGMRRLKGAHRWGVDIFMNWLLPVYLLELGYTYSIKADYDLLCVAPYATFEKVIPEERLYSAMWIRRGKSVLQPDAAAKASEILGTSVEHPSSVNVGFMVINNRRYVETDFLTRFQNIYELIATEAPEVRLPEQMAAALVGHRTPPSGIHGLSKAYNQRQKYYPSPGNMSPVVYNIHYITKYKPWRPLPTEKIERFCSEHAHVMIPYYRAMWLHHAATLDGFEAFTTERPYTPLQYAGLGAITHYWSRRAGHDAALAEGHATQTTASVAIPDDMDEE